jgi:hypothetical protein
LGGRGHDRAWSATIIPDLDLDTLGLCTHESPTNNALILYPDDYATLLPAIEKGVMVTLAGLHAECRYNGQPTERESDIGWGSDLEAATLLVKLAVELKHDGLDIELWPEECAELFDQLSIETEIMVNKHWPAIERVAQGLLDRSVLNGADVDDLIGQKAVEQFMREAKEAMEQQLMREVALCLGKLQHR